VQCNDAEIILLTAGTTVSTCRQVVDTLRSKGEKIGLLKLKMFRPFPTTLIRDLLAGGKKVAVVDRNCSFGAGGIFAQELRAALCNSIAHPLVFGYIAGLGGRDVTADTIEEIYWKTKKERTPKAECIWIGLNQETLESWSN
jgi:pyruvate/2-oxoacid:ferredoxin oxidoreductase alpha subunit